ncbi:MAG: inorganic pyrophosphatase Ppa [Syntrophales bacterium]
MTLKKSLGKTERFQLQVLKKPPVFTAHVQHFIGSPMKHPYRDERMILIMNPFSSRICYIEFNINDIEAIEEMHSIVDRSGESLPMVKIWVRKGSLGVKSSPFIV